jgi:hypothetical protein
MVSGHVKTQLIAHDKEVYDIAFSKAGGGRDMFASVGAGRWKGFKSDLSIVQIGFLQMAASGCSTSDTLSTPRSSMRWDGVGQSDLSKCENGICLANSLSDHPSPGPNPHPPAAAGVEQAGPELPCHGRHGRLRGHHPRRPCALHARGQASRHSDPH